MGYANIQADSNFYRQSLNADGIKDVTGPYTSLYEDVFRAITVTTDSVVSVTSYVGDSLSNQFLFAGTEIYGLFSSVTIHSGNAILHLAGASYISEIINQYSASGIPLGFYEEGTQCLSQKISALLTQGVFDDASLVMVPSQYKEDTVRAFKPTSGLGDLDFSRASTATRVNSAGLIEKVRTNIILQSQNLAAAAWSLIGTATRTANYGTAPDGTQTSTRIQWTAAAFFELYQYTGLSAPIYGSVYIKGTAGQTIKYTGNSVTLNGSWQRIEGFIAVDGANTYFTIAGTPGTNTAFDFELWGAQAETGDIATAYIPTTTAAVSVGPVANVPRLDYLGSTCPRLLLEPQRTNLLQYSEQFNNAYYEVGSAASISANTSETLDPAGLNGADKLTANGTGQLYVRNNVYFGTAQTCTNSIFAKKANHRYVGFRNSGTFSAHDVFDFDTKTWTNNSGATLSYDELGNGWFRLKSTNTDAVNLNYYWSVIPAVNTSGFENTTASNLSVYIWGGQAEQNAAYATSYIPTLAATVTRVADFYAKAGFGNTSTAGTLYYEFQNYQSPAAANGFYMVCLFAGSTITDNFFSAAESISIINNGFAIEGRNDGYATTLFSFTPAINATVKIALRYDGTNVVAFVNGVKGTVFSDTAVGAKNAIRVNNGENATHATKQLLYFPSALTDDQLAALTTL